MAAMSMEFLLVLVFTAVISAQTTYYSEYKTPTDCKNGLGDNNHEFYDPKTLSCELCSQNRTFQKASLNRE